MLILRRKLNTETNEPTMVLNGLAEPVATETVSVKVYWRWEDEPEMTPQFLGETVPGDELVVPFDLGGRSIRLYQIGYTALGRGTDTNMKEAVQTLFEPPTAPAADEGEFEAYEDLDAGDVLNIFDDGGIAKVRKADASDNTKPAHCFCVDNAVGSSFLGGDTVRVFFISNEHAIGLAALTPGQRLYLSETAGEMTATPPTGSGKVVQVLGVAKSATTMLFQPEEPVTLR